jgi:hypothetical protein
MENIETYNPEETEVVEELILEMNRYSQSNNGTIPAALKEKLYKF